MKGLKIISILAIMTLFFAVSLMARGPGYGAGRETQTHVNIVSQFPYQSVNAAEKAGLLEMREEEKLARDVYLALYSKWQHRIFGNISQAEQVHMDAIGSLLGKYGIADPVTNNAPGIFSNPELRDLYQVLVAKGNGSLEDALLVGATIEDLDIYDLNRLVSQTDNADVQAVYRNLIRGSMNHMRAFTRVLSDYGIYYAAQYLSQSEVDEIISSSWE